MTTHPVKIVQVFRVEREVVVYVPAEDHDSAVEKVDSGFYQTPDFDDTRWSDDWDLQSETASKVELTKKRTFAPMPPPPVPPMNLEDSVQRLRKGKPDLVPYIVKKIEYDMRGDPKLQDAGLHPDAVHLVLKAARETMNELRRALKAKQRKKGDV